MVKTIGRRPPIAIVVGAARFMLITIVLLFVTVLYRHLFSNKILFLDLILEQCKIVLWTFECQKPTKTPQPITRLRHFSSNFLMIGGRKDEAFLHCVFEQT